MKKDVWERFEAMLQAHAPDLLATFRPPATAAQIAEAEAAMGVQFPEEIRHAYLRHDGAEHRDGTQDGWLFVPFNWWAPLSEALSYWQMKMEVRDSLAQETHTTLFPEANSKWDSEKIAPVWWNEKWIPIGLSGTPTSTYVDLDPAPQGTHGQLIDDSGMQEAVWLSSGLDHYLELLIERVESGRLIYRGEWISTSTDESVNWENFDLPPR